MPLPIRMAQVAAMAVSASCSQVALSLIIPDEQPKVSKQQHGQQHASAADLCGHEHAVSASKPALVQGGGFGPACMDCMTSL